MDAMKLCIYIMDVDDGCIKFPLSFILVAAVNHEIFNNESIAQLNEVLVFSTSVVVDIHKNFY